MIAGRLTMRAAVERNGATAMDDWGNPVTPVFVSIGDPIACFVWSTAARGAADGEKVTETEEFRGLFALDADLRANDEVAAITDRSDTEIIGGRLRVMGPVQRKHTHVEANLRRIA